MENLSNNKLTLAPLSLGEGLGVRSHNTRNSLRLFLVLFHFSFFIFHFSFLKAQNAYNKLYTLQALGGMFNAVAPHGNLGGYMAAATVVDSITRIQAIRIARIDAKGNLQASNYFNVPDDTARTLFINYKAMTRVHDNCYAIVGTVIPSAKQYAFILLADSNGVVYKYKDLIFKDTNFDYISSVKYDGLGHVIACGHYFTSPKVSDSSYGVIYKFDTALNLVWQKHYHPSSILLYPAFFSLDIDSSGYTLGGGGTNGHFNSDKPFKSQSLVIKTDTAGVLQWSLASPAVFYTDYQSYIGAIVHTKDGGYLYTTEGHTYNSYPSSAPVIQLAAKQLIIKVDAARNKQWEIVVDDYFGVIGYVPRTSLIELDDSSFLFLGGRTTDSLDPFLKTGKLVLQHYSSKGVLLTQRIINKYAPRSIDDTHKESGGPIYDIKQTADKAFVLCGYYENKTIGAPAPAQRGWLLKLDSNLCLGVGDSQCMPSSIIEQPQVSGAGFKVYPNPTSNTIHLSIAANELLVYNTYGQVVLQANNILAQQSIPVSHLSSGLYFVAVFDKERNKVEVGKFYKE